MAEEPSDNEPSIAASVTSQKSRYADLQKAYANTTGPPEPPNLTRSNVGEYSKLVRDYVWYRNKEFVRNGLTDSNLFASFMESFGNWTEQRFNYVGTVNLATLWMTLRAGGCYIPEARYPVKLGKVLYDAVKADKWNEWTPEMWYEGIHTGLVAPL